MGNTGGTRVLGSISASQKKIFVINLDVNLFFRYFKKGRNTVDLEQTIHHVCIMWSQSVSQTLL